MNAVQRMSSSYNALWVCCRLDQIEWITSESIKLYKHPLNNIAVYLDRGGPEFLFKFLKIVSPHLPFDRIIEADLEFLVQELEPIFYRQRSDYDILSDAEVKSKKWFPQVWKEGSICISLDNEGEPNYSATQSTLAALRLASFCILGSQILVLDRLNAITSFKNSFEDPSGNWHYIFEILHLDTIK
jgi:hypothetical protein